MYRVLAIDGGGIRGVIPATLLVHLENAVGRRIAEMFDLMVGTSTGGILAAGLAVRAAADPGHPKFTAQDMLDLYEQRGREIFHRSLWDGITSVGGLADEKYDEGPLEELLQSYLGDATLKDTLRPVILTSYDIEQRRPYFFKTRRADLPGRNHYLRDAARATSAAPTYFEPEVVLSLDAQPTRRALIDGGVFINNPALAGYTEAIDMKKSPDEIAVVSLGTGVATRPILFDDAKDWGKLGWVAPIISVMMDGQADSAHFHLEQLMPAADAPTQQRYFRFDTQLTEALDDLDAATASNIASLKREAAAILQDQRDEMDRLVALLRQP